MRIYKQAETFALAAGKNEDWRTHYKDYLVDRDIKWTPEQQGQRRQLEDELRRRQQAGEIGPLDATNPQSMSDANKAHNDLFYDPQDGMVRRPA